MLIEAEIERLHKEKTEMMQQVIELKNENRQTHQYMESVNEKLKAAEHKQKQMVSFLAQVFQNPTFVASIHERKEQMLRLSSPRTTRRFVRHQPHEHNPFSAGGSLRNVEECDPKGKNVLTIEPEAAPEYLLGPISGGFDDVNVKEEPIWSDLGNYELPEFGAGGGELGDLWNLGSENWQDDSICFDDIEKKEDDSSKKIDP